MGDSTRGRGTASAKALRRDCAWRLQGTAERLVGMGRASEGERKAEEVRRVKRGAGGCCGSLEEFRGMGSVWSVLCRGGTCADILRKDHSGSLSREQE